MAAAGSASTNVGDREQALATLTRLVNQRLASLPPGRRAWWLACSAWSVDDTPDTKSTAISKEDLTACKDAVRVVVGRGKSLPDTTLRKELRDLINFKKLPPTGPIHDKRLNDVVQELRKRVTVKVSPETEPKPIHSATQPSAVASSSRTPRQDSISYEESLRRRVQELEKQLEDTKQSLEKLLADN